MKLLYGVTLMMCVVISFIDQATSPIAVFALTVICCLLSIRNIKKDAESNAVSLVAIVSFVYFLIAFINSRNFIGNNFFIVSDSLQYTQWVKLMKPEDDYWHLLVDNYVGLLDHDTLHEVFVRVACIVANRYLGNASVYYLTVLHSMFGVFAILSLYKTLLYYYKPKDSYKYALIFAFCSPFLFYSTVIIRDIVIAFCFMKGIEIVLGEYKKTNNVFLFIWASIALGVRMYSGIFMLSFIGIYIAKKMEISKYKKAIIPLALLMTAVVIGSGIMTNLLDQTKTELQYYNDFESEVVSASGLSSALYSLPSGIKEVSLLFYSQIMPIPFFVNLQGAENITQYIEALTTIIYPVWWFYIFYSLFYFYTNKKGYSKLCLWENMLMWFSILFILMNTAQIDVRRIMPIYPFLFILSLRLKEQYSSKEVKFARRMLLSGYVALTLLYLVIK